MGRRERNDVARNKCEYKTNERWNEENKKQDKDEIIKQIEEIIEIYSEETKKMKAGSCKLETCKVKENLKLNKKEKNIEAKEVETNIEIEELKIKVKKVKLKIEEEESNKKIQIQIVGKEVNKINKRKRNIEKLKKTENKFKIRIGKKIKENRKQIGSERGKIKI